MRVEIHYDDGEVERLEGDSALVYMLRPEPQPQDGLRATLGLSGRLDAVGICMLLTLLEMQLDLQQEPARELVAIAIELWEEHRVRLMAEAAVCNERYQEEAEPNE